MTIAFDAGTAIEVEVLPTFPVQVAATGLVTLTQTNGIYTF
jgi:hypothetical protein